MPPHRAHRGRGHAETQDRAGDLQIFGLTLSQLSYLGCGRIGARPLWHTHLAGLWSARGPACHPFQPDSMFRLSLFAAASKSWPPLARGAEDPPLPRHHSPTSRAGADGATNGEGRAGRGRPSDCAHQPVPTAPARLGRLAAPSALWPAWAYPFRKRVRAAFGALACARAIAHPRRARPPRHRGELVQRVRLSHAPGNAWPTPAAMDRGPAPI